MNANDVNAGNAHDESAKPAGNGSKSRRLLAAHGATVATPRFGSQSVITTIVDNDCRVDVVEELMPLIADKLRHHGRNAEPVTLDGLDISALVECTLTNLADLCQPLADINSVRATLEVVLASKQGRGIEVVARIREAIDQVVEPAVATVLERIRSLADSSPDCLLHLGTETLATLARAKPVFLDSASVIQEVQQQVVRMAESIGRVGDFAADDQQAIVGVLQERARERVREAFAAVVREFVLKELLAQWHKLTDAADALLHLEGELTSQLDALNREWHDWADEQRKTLVEPPCSTTLRLAGTSKEEALAGVLERHRFAGRHDLVSYVLERGVTRLREASADRVNQDIATRPAARLLASLPPTEAFAAFRDVLSEELASEVQTIYGRLQRHGTIRVLQSLIDRSRLTSDPGPRAETRFKLNAYRIVIVSLPAVTRSQDQAVRNAITRALDSKGVIVTEHASDFDEIVAHRVGGGWPWQILPSNEHLCKQHVAAAAAGHRSNLVGILPESPRGEINPTYLTLPQRRPNHESF